MKGKGSWGKSPACPTTLQGRSYKKGEGGYGGKLGGDLSVRAGF